MSNWNDLTDLEQAAVLYSDAHKSAYGFRPRDGGVHNPQTLKDYEIAMDEMTQIMIGNQAEEERYEAIALEVLNAEITELMADHNIDNRTALRWWFQSEGFTMRSNIGWSRQDAEHILWKRGIAIRDWPTFINAFLPLPMKRAA